MLDAKYEDLLATYIFLCDRHEKAVDQLLSHVNDGRHADSRRIALQARELASQAHATYLALRARRQQVDQA